MRHIAWSFVAGLLVSGGAFAQPNLSEVQRLVVSNDGGSGDAIGRSVAVSGNTAVVGAPFHTDEENDQGAAWVFERDPATNSWSLAKKLVASDAGFDNFFGASVAISGDFIAVGAPGNDIGFDVDRGSAYVFERDAGGLGTWGQVAEPIAATGEANDRFGSAVAIDGNTLVVGAPFIDISDGGFFVFERSGGAWLERGRIDVSDGEFASRFGSAVAIHGDTIVAGSPEAGNGGAAWVFARDAGNAEDGWSFVAELDRADPDADDEFGTSVAVHGDTALVGAPEDNVASSVSQGSAYVFERNLGGPNAWGKVTQITASDGDAGDLFGRGVALRGDLGIVVAPGVSEEGGAGVAYTFGRNQAGPDAWGELQRLLPSDGEGSFAASVALTGGLFGFNAVIGAPGASFPPAFGKGAAYVFGNTRPIVVVGDVAGVIGGGGVALQIATIEDGEQPPETLAVRIDGGDSATKNGVTVANLAIGADGAVTADVTVSCGASGASFELAFEDASGEVATATLDIDASPSEPPSLQLRPPLTLRLPIHLYHFLSVPHLVTSATDDCDGDVASGVVIEQITSDEPDDAPGLADGFTRNDVVVLDCRTALVRAERSRLGNGRVYGITLRAEDSEGNASHAVFEVKVPKGVHPAVEDAPALIVPGCP